MSIIRSGSPLLANVLQLGERLDRLERESAEIKADIVRINARKISIRIRLLDTFKCGVNAIDYDRRRINHIAPGPDFLDDAILYERGLRVDEDVFLSLYGLRPSRANDLCTRDRSDIVDLIDTMAALVADPDIQVSANLQNRYTRFLGLIDENASNATASDRTSELDKAYFEWWSTYNKEVGG